MGAVGSGGGGTAISGGKALATLLEDKTVRAIETKGFIKNIVSYIDSSVISSGEYVSKKISKLSDYLRKQLSSNTFLWREDFRSRQNYR